MHEISQEKSDLYIFVRLEKNKNVELRQSFWGNS